MPINWDEIYSGQSKRNSPEAGKNPNDKKPSWDEIYSGRASSGGIQQRKKLSGLDAFLSGAGDSLSFGWGDEIQGALSGIGSVLSGGDYWSGYNRSVNDARNWQKKAAIDEGGWKFAGDIGGALLGGVLSGGGLALAGNAARGGAAVANAAGAAQKMGLLSRMGRAAPFAALGGAAYGAGASNGGEEGDMLLNAGIGAAAGAVSGPLFEALGSGVKKGLIDPLLDLNPSRQASKYIARELDRYGVKASDLSKNIKELTDVDPENAWAMDAFGPLGPDLVKASSAAAGPELAAMEKAAKARNKSVSEGALKSFWEKLGGGANKRIDYVSRVSAIDDELSNFDSAYKLIDAQKLDPSSFPQAMKKFIAENSPESWKVDRAGGVVNDLTSKPTGLFRDAMEAATEVAGAEAGGAIPAHVLQNQPIFWRTFLTQARKAKDAAYQRGDASLGERMSVQYNSLRKSLGEVLGPGWVKAQERYAALKAEREGLEFGFKAIMQTDAPSLADNLKLFNNMTPAQKKWARMGMISRLEEGIRSQQTRGSTRDMLRKVADNPLQANALARFFARVNKDGSIDNRFTKLSAMLDDLDKRYTFFDNINRSGILGGSKTASVLTRAADQADRTMPAAGDVLKGDILGAVRKAITGDMTERFDQDVANEIIKFMRSPVRVTDKAGNLVGGIEHEIASKGLEGWLNGPSAVQKALKRQMQLQKAYNDRWGVARSNLFAGVGGGAFGDLLTGD